MNPTLRPKRRYRHQEAEVPPEPLRPAPAPETGSGSHGHRLKRSGRRHLVPRAPHGPVATPKEQFVAAVSNALHHILPLRHSH
jgi:hypothetical protein